MVKPLSKGNLKKGILSFIYAGDIGMSSFKAVSTLALWVKKQQSLIVRTLGYRDYVKRARGLCSGWGQMG